MTLDLEVFKKMSQKERDDYGETFPDGYTFDKNGKVLTAKTHDGYWREYIRDEKGYPLTYKRSDGYSHQYTYNENGKVLTFKDSNGFCFECTYDESGKELTYSNSMGVNSVNFFWGKDYALGYDKEANTYIAGCQELNYEDCEYFYESNKDEFEDSHNFIEAIREHQKTLTESEKSVQYLTYQTI